MKKEENCSLFFRMPKKILTPFFIEALIEGGYYYFYYISTKDTSDVEWFISKSEKDKAAKIGLKLYRDEIKVKGLIEDGKGLSLKIKKFLSVVNKLENDKIIDKIEQTRSYFINFAKIYSNTEDMYTANLEETDLAIKSISVSIRRIGKAKFILRSTLNKLWSLLDRELKEIRKEINFEGDLSYCLYGEIIDLIKSKNSQKTLEKINERKKALLIYKKSRIYIKSGKYAEKIIRNLKKPILSQTINEFKGDVANKGYARGKVLILPIGFNKNTNLLNRKISKMKRGGIIVAQAFGPEMTHAFKKAGAIICEWGGITSHAAVISRELGIPGIINTKIATKVLKDGDLVEVDADKGVVKILRGK